MKIIFLIFTLICGVAAQGQAAAPTESQDEQDRFVNIRLMPTGLVFGYYGASLDFKVADHFAFGPEMRILGNSGLPLADLEYSEEFTAYQGGLRLTWFQNGAFKNKGLYAAAAVEYGYSSATVCFYDGTCPTDSASVWIFYPAVGYAVFWSHFNLMMGAGWGFSTKPSSFNFSDSTGANTKSTSSFGSGILVDCSLGWTF